MQPVIELNNITKTFTEHSFRTILFRKNPKRVEALKGISLEVQQGEVFGLLGPNGAGKTTLIKILATLILADGGSARICGLDLLKHSTNLRRLVGLVNTNDRSFYWRLTGRQNLEFFAALYNPTASHRKKLVGELLDMVGLKDKADTRFMKYSSGQKQRLAIARVLLVDPKALLMDEPTNSLDPIAASELRKFTKETLVGAQGKTVLWCTHNLKEAEEICDRLAIIHKGKIIASGSLRDMQSLIKEKSLYQLKVGSRSQEALQQLGISPIYTFQNNGYMEFELKEKEENISFLIKRLIEKGIKVYSFRHKEIELDEIFERLIQKES